MTGCIYCPTAAAEGHHVTGRGPDGAYLDPELRVPLCVACHHLDHQGWRAVGLDVEPDPVLARVGRLAFLVLRLGELGRPVALGSDFWLALWALLVDVETAWRSR